MNKPAMDAETRAVARDPGFKALIAEGRASKAEGGISPEELDRRDPLTHLDREFAEAFGAALDRLEEAQGTEVTDDQGRLLKIILTAADYVRGRAPLVQLAADSGIDEPTLRAAAAALQIVGLEATKAAGRVG